MPRLDVSIGPNGPIVDVRLSVGPERAASLAAAGLAVPEPISVLGLVDTGAEMTAIQRSLAEWMDIGPISDPAAILIVWRAASGFLLPARRRNRLSCCLVPSAAMRRDRS